MTNSLVKEDRRQVSDDFLIGALYDAILLLRIRRGKRVIRANKSREFSDQLVVESSPSIRVYRFRSTESAEMLKQTGSSLIGTNTRCGKELNPSGEVI